MPPLGVDDDRWKAEGALIGDAGALNGELSGEMFSPPGSCPETCDAAGDKLIV